MPRLGPRELIPCLVASVEPAALDVVLAMKRFPTWTIASSDRGARTFRQPKVLGLVHSFCQDRPGVRRLFAEDTAEKHPDRAIRGQATLILGRMDRVT